MLSTKLNLNLIKVRLSHSWQKPYGYDTGLKVYNCVAREKVPLVLRNKYFATWYTCGPTVYESAHIGHASCYIKLDIIQRILRDHFKINLVTVMNITDIDDKIIKRSNDKRITPKDLAIYYENEFWEDLNKLNVRKPNKIIRVTEQIPVILDYIYKLVDNKCAYKATDGSIYFDVTEYKNKYHYGKLENIGGDLKVENIIKKSPADFALWKAPKDGEIFWKSKYGPGRPGWHIECSALAGLSLGSEIDFHAGGIDLRFPHHENEEAQSCAYFSKQQWVNYWLHTGHLHLKGSVKMSKSLQNTLSIQEMLSTKCKPEVFRMACLMSHYRKNMEFSDELLRTAEDYLDIYKHFMELCECHIHGEIIGSLDIMILLNSYSETVNAVNNALLDDFDTATCIKSINSLVTTTNKMLHSAARPCESNVDTTSLLIAILNFINTILNNFGLTTSKSIKGSGDDNEFSNIMNILVNFRHDLRQLGITNKDKSLLELCDNVRDNVKKCGISLNDRDKVTTWSK